MAQGLDVVDLRVQSLDRMRPGHHGYRFDLEQGVDVEDMRVQPLDRMRRFSAMVLLSAQIVFVISVHWPPNAVLWLRQLGGKLGLTSGREGPLS